VVNEATVILPLAELIDLNAERARLQATRAKAAAELEKVRAKLTDKNFTARAPEQIITENEEREKKYLSEISRLDAALARIA
jgi:valyl-tRNA synthetase